MSFFCIVYQKVPHHFLDLAKLSIGEKFSNAASIMTKQAIDIQKEIRKAIDIQKEIRIRLEKSNVRCKTAANKEKEKVFEEGDMIIVYLRK